MTTTSNIRWQIGWLLFAGTAANFVARTNLAFALAPMSQDLAIREVGQGYLLSIFFAGYIVFNIVGGWCADRFGARLTLGLSFICWALVTGLTAAVWSFSALLGLRLLTGMASGPVFPTCAQVVTRWFPPRERGRATALFDVGSYIGSALTGPLVVGSMLLIGWRGAFLICAAIGFIWSIGWFLFYRSPNNHATFTPSKPEPVCNAPVASRGSSLWIQYLRSQKVWGMMCGFFCYNYLKVFFLSWFPTFLLVQKNFPTRTMALASVLPPLSAVVGEFAAGWGTDRLLQEGVPVTLARKIPLCLGLLLSGVTALAVFTTSHFWTLIWLSVGYACVIGASPGIWAIPGDVSPTPDTVGQLGGLQNAFANIGSLLAPIVTGYLWEYYGSFAPAVVLSSVLGASGAFSYWFVVGKLEPLPLGPKSPRSPLNR